MRRRATAGILVLWLVSGLLAGCRPAGPTVWLKVFQDKLERADGLRATIIITEPAGLVWEHRLYWRRDGAYRIEVVQPKGLAGQYTVSDGRQLWWVSQRGTVFGPTPVAAGLSGTERVLGLLAASDLYRAGLKYTRAGDRYLARLDDGQLTVEFRGGQPVAWERRRANDELVVAAELREIVFGPLLGDVSFTPPSPGTAPLPGPWETLTPGQAQAHLGGLSLPAGLAGRAELQGIRVGQGEPFWLAALYAGQAGQVTLTVSRSLDWPPFAGMATRERSGRAFLTLSAGNLRIVAWQEMGYQLVLLGNLGLEEMMTLALIR
ncbi:MAG: hypothetical protein AB1331_02825 [Bacillota bacterium]